MILYLDTSALVKAFVVEEGSEDVHAWIDEAAVVSTSTLAYPEAMAAFSRRLRERDLSESAARRVVAAFQEQWDEVLTVQLDERDAGDLALRFPIRGADACHLSAALSLQCQGVEESPVARGAERSGLGALGLLFVSYDRRLNHAAQAAGLRVAGPR